MAVVIGGEGSNVNQEFLKAYSKISGTGRSAAEQIQDIQSRVDNKLVNSQEQIDPTGRLAEQNDGRREIDGVTKVAADVQKFIEPAFSAAGDFVFGKDMENDNPLEGIGRIGLNLIPSTIAAIPYAATKIPEAGSGTSFEYYDAETGTVPDDETGTLTTAGRAATLGSGLVDLAGTRFGLGVAGRAAGGAVKAGAAAAGKAVSKKLGNNLAAEGPTVGRAALEGAKRGLGKKPTEPHSEIGKVARSAREGWEDIAQKNIGTRMISGAVEESAQEVVQESMDWLASNDDRFERGELNSEDYAGLVDNLGYAAYAGAIGGGMFGGIQGLSEAAGRRSAIKKAENESKNEVIGTSTTDSDQSSAASDRFVDVLGMHQVNNEAAQQFTKDSKSNKIAGQSTVVVQDPDIGINSFGMGRETLSAIYVLKDGEEQINGLLGEKAAELNISLEDALLAPQLYDNGKARGEKAAIEDLNTLLKEAGGMDGFIWKDPANGFQMKLNVNKIVGGNELLANQAISGLFNGDFDTDRLGVSLDSNISAAALMPTQLLASNAVEGKVNLKLDYTKFKDFASSNITEKDIADEIKRTNPDMAVNEINDFVKDFVSKYEEASNHDNYNEVRAQVLSKFLSSPLTSRFSGSFSEQFFGALQLKGDPIDRALEQSKVKIIDEIKRSAKEIIDQTGSVPDETAPRELLVKLNKIEPHRTGKPLREAAVWLFETAKEMGMEYFTTPAAIRHAMRFQNISNFGEKPQEVLKMAYRDLVRVHTLRAMQKLPNSKFTTEEDFDIFKDIVNAHREPYEKVQSYYQLDGPHVFEQFTGSTAPIESQIGAIKAFEQIFGDMPFENFFILDDASVWKGCSVSYVFHNVAKLKTGACNAFSHYDPKYELMWINGIKSTYRASAENAYKILWEAVKEAVSRPLHPDAKGLVPAEEMMALNMRWGVVTSALRQRIRNLGLHDAASIDKYKDFYDKGFVSSDPDVFMRMLASLSCIDECRDLNLARELYNSDPSTENAELLRGVALKQVQLLAPPYQLIAADVLDKLDAGETNIEAGGLYNLLSTLHESTDVQMEQLDAIFNSIYESKEFASPSYNSLIVDLLVTSGDEMSLGQLKEDFALARTYSRKAAMADRELADLRFDELMKTAGLLGDPPQYVVWIVEEMASEPVLWDRRVISENLRSGGFPTAASKEKAKAETFAKIVHGGLAEASEGYKTEEDRLFMDSSYKAPADTFFSDAATIRDFLFGDQDVVREVIGADGKSIIVTKKDFFEWATGDTYSAAPEHQDRQIFDALQKRRTLLSTLMPSTLTTSVSEAIKKNGKQEVAKYYEDRRSSRNERFIERRNKQRIEEAIQEDPSAIKFIYGLMLKRNGEEPLPFTNPHKFFELCNSAISELVNAIYYNVTISADEITSEQLGKKAKAESMHKFLVSFAERLETLYEKKRLSDNDQMNIENLMNDTVADMAITSAMDKIFGSDVATITAKIEGSPLAAAEFVENIEVARSILDLQTNAMMIAMSRYDMDKSISYEDVIARMDKRIRNIPNEVLIEYERKLKRVGPDVLIDADMVRRELLEKIASYDEVTHDSIMENGLKIDPKDAKLVIQLPATFEEFMKEEKPSKFFEDYNPDINFTDSNTDLTRQTRMFARMMDLAHEVSIAKAEQEQSLIAETEHLNKVRENAKVNMKRKLGEQYTPEKEAEINTLFDMRIAQATSAINQTTENKLANIEEEYQSLAATKDTFAYASLMTRVQSMGDPLNPMAVYDLDMLNGEFLTLCDKYRQAVVAENEEFAMPERIPAGATRGRIHIPQFSTIDPTVKSAIVAAQVALSGGDVEIGTALGANGSGRRSIWARLKTMMSCKAPGRTMLYEEAMVDDSVISIRIDTPKGQRVIPLHKDQKNLADLIDGSLIGTNVVAYSKNECRCPGCCSNHDLTPVYNANTENNAMAIFFSQLAYFMEEVEQLQKKKALSSATSSAFLFPELERRAELRQQEIATDDMAGVVQACEAYRDVLLLWNKDRINDSINRMKTDAQSKMLDVDFFAERLTDHCTRFVQLKVYLADGTTMFEYQTKRDQLAERIDELKNMEGVANVTVIPVSVSPKESELAAIRYMKDKEEPEEVLIMQALQDEGAKIKLLEDGTFTHTDSVTFKPGQLDLDEYYNLAPVTRMGKSELPPGPGEQLPWLKLVEDLMGSDDYTDPKPKRNGTDPYKDPRIVTKSTEERLIQMADRQTPDGNKYFIVNMDTTGYLGKDQSFVHDNTFAPAFDGGGETHFGLHADAIKPPFNRIAAVSLLNPTAKMIEDYGKWASTIPQKTHIFIPSSFGQEASDSGYQFTEVGNFIQIEIDPIGAKESEVSGGFKAQTIRKEKDFLPIVESQIDDIGDGVVYLPKSYKGEKQTLVVHGSFKLTDLMKNRIGEATIVPEGDRGEVLEAFAKSSASRIFQAPPSWEQNSAASSAAALKKYENAELNQQGLARNCISASDIVCVIALPPMKGDMNGTVTYYPVTVGDMGLGSSVDEVYGRLSTDGSGFDFAGFTEFVWDSGYYRKFQGHEAALKATAIVSDKLLSHAANGLECAEAKAADLIDKTLETSTSKVKKFMNFYQVARNVAGRLVSRSMWIEPDPNGGYKVKDGINEALAGYVEPAMRSYQRTTIYDKIIEGTTYRKEGTDGFDAEAEIALKQFLVNCRKLNASPAKLLSPMIVENGELVYQVFDDPIMNLYFNNMSENQMFLMFNYITDGEFCPPNTTDMSDGYTINYNYEMQMIDGSYRFFTLHDRTFNSENISIIDGTSDSVTNGMQQSVRKLAYSNATKHDIPAIARKQALDAGDYESLMVSDEEHLKRIRKEQAQDKPPVPEFVKNINDVADLLKAAAPQAIGNSFTANMSEFFEAFNEAYVKPAPIHRLDSKGEEENVGFNHDDWVKKIRPAFLKATGLSENKSWNDQKILGFISNLMVWTPLETGIKSFSVEEVMAMLEQYKRDIAKTGVFPRSKIVVQGGDVKTARYGTCGRLGHLQQEWELPLVQKSFGTWENFLTKAGEFQRNQKEEYRGMLGATEQKIKAYHYIQLFLEAELNDVVPGGVGKTDIFDWNGRADKDANDILRLLGYETTNMAEVEAMNEYATKAYKEMLQQAARDSGAYQTKRKQKKDKDGNPIPRRAGRTEGVTKIGEIFDVIYSLRVANALALNPALIGANVMQTVVNGQNQKMANRFSYLTNGAFKNGLGVQPSDYNIVSDAAEDALLSQFFKLNEMTAFYNDPTLLEGFFEDPDATIARTKETLNRGPFAKRWARKYARFASNMATGFSAGMKPISENFLFRFGQYMGDTDWLSRHIVDEKGMPVQFTEPIMTNAEWETILMDAARLHEFLGDVSKGDHYLNVLYRAAIQDSLRVTWTNKNIATELLSSTLTSLGNSKAPISTKTAEGLIAIGVSPFLKYYTNLAMYFGTAMNGIPCQTLLHIAHNSGMDLKHWLTANGVKADIITRIDFEEMASSRSLKEAMLRDSIKFGGVWFLSLVAQSILQLEPPEDDDLKDNFEEYSVGILKTDDGQPFRIRMLWPLQDILGPFGPVAVYWSTVLAGKPRPAILANGMAGILQNSATMLASNISGFMNDPLLWQRETNDTEMGAMNGANVTEEDPAMTSADKFYMQGILALYRIIVPNALDNFLKPAPGTEPDVSSNYIYELDDSGKPTGRQNPDTGQFYLEKTNQTDAAWRRLSKRYPIMGHILNLQGAVSGRGGTGYTTQDMPRIIRYSPFQMASMEMYQMTGDVAHDDKVAADVIAMLASYDDLDDLIETGFYISADTRFYVGQKVWDTYNSYQDQIDQAYALGLNDYQTLGNGDYIEGQKIWSQWLGAMNDQKEFYKEFYYDKLNSEQLRLRMETANVIRQSYDKDANGEWYATGFENDNPWAFLSIASRFGNAGNEGGWSSIDPLVGLPIGERGWIWNTANTYFDGMKFEEFSARGDGKGYSSIHREGGEEEFTDLLSLQSLVATRKSSGGYSSYRRSGGGYSSGGGGGGGGGIPKLYSNPQDLNVDRPTLARMSRLYDSRLDYIRPDWETKGSGTASRRSDI